MTGAMLDYTLLYVPRAVDVTALGTPPFFDVQAYRHPWEANPLAWLMRDKGGMLLFVTVRPGYFGKRRIGTGIVSIADPEQRAPLLDLIEQLIELMTPNRWVMFATWFGWGEIREIRRVGEPTDELLATAEDDVWYRFERKLEYT